MKSLITMKNVSLCLSQMLRWFAVLPTCLAISIAFTLGVYSSSSSIEVGYILTAEDVTALNEISKFFIYMIVVSVFISFFGLIKSLREIKLQVPS